MIFYKLFRTTLMGFSFQTSFHQSDQNSKFLNLFRNYKILYLLFESFWMSSQVCINFINFYVYTTKDYL